MSLKAVLKSAALTIVLVILIGMMVVADAVSRNLKGMG